MGRFFEKVAWVVKCNRRMNGPWLYRRLTLEFPGPSEETLRVCEDCLSCTLIDGKGSADVASQNFRKIG